MDVGAFRRISVGDVLRNKVDGRSYVAQLVQDGGVTATRYVRLTDQELRTETWLHGNSTIVSIKQLETGMRIHEGAFRDYTVASTTESYATLFDRVHEITEESAHEWEREWESDTPLTRHPSAHHVM